MSIKILYLPSPKSIFWLRPRAGLTAVLYASQMMGAAAATAAGESQSRLCAGSRSLYNNNGLYNPYIGCCNI